jgi:hypothetical protein
MKVDDLLFTLRSGTPCDGDAIGGVYSASFRLLASADAPLLCASHDPEEGETGLDSAHFWTPDNTAEPRAARRGTTDISGVRVAGSEGGSRPLPDIQGATR